MSGPDFFQTGMGRRFYESTMPDIATAMLRIAGALEKPPKLSEPILTILHTLANAEDGYCYCRVHRNDCPDCDGCVECPTGRARTILAALEDK